MTTAEPLAGRVLGSFRVDRRLGEGGIGAVYAATHTRTGRRYAVKVLLPEMAMKTGAIERFRREAEALAALGHAGIVSIHDFDVTPEGTQFLVMDLLEGEDLASRIERGGALPVPDALRIADDIAAALGAAHAVGIVHRDLKPANVFLARRAGAPEHATVLDFGLAKNVRAEERVRLTVTGAGLGTPLYMSPEQARGIDVDHATDVYSLGCIVFEMIAGTPPFEAATLTAVIAKILSDPPPLLSARAKQPVPAALDAVVQSALAKDPAARPASTEAFIAALHEAAGTVANAGSRESLVRTGPAAVVAARLPGPTSPSGPILPTMPSVRDGLLATRPSAPDEFSPVGSSPQSPLLQTAVRVRASGEGGRRSPALLITGATLLLLTLTAGGVAIGMSMGGDPRSTSTVTVTATRQAPVIAQPVVAPVRLTGEGPSTPPPPSAPVHVDEPPPHVAVRGAHTQRTPTQRIADAMERQVAAERRIAAAPPPPPVAPTAMPPELVAQIERSRQAQRASAAHADELAHGYQTALAFFTPLRAELHGVPARQRPAFCTDATRARLDTMARGADDTESAVASRADALREAIGPLCTSFETWDAPPPEVGDRMRRLRRDLDHADDMLRDAEANRQGAAQASEIAAALADVRVVVEHADASGRRFPCDSPAMVRLRSLQHNGNGWADAAAGNVTRAEDDLCRTLGVQRQQLESEARRVSNVLDGTESGLRDNIRAQRDVAAQLRAGADGVVP